MSNSFLIDHRSAPQPWLRLWLPESYWNANPGIDDDFLTDHGQRAGAEHLLNEAFPGIGTLADFKEVPFLFLLGRPGSGKSSELAQAKRQGWLGDRCCWVEGKEFGADVSATLDRLIARRDGINKLCIDGLDEALLEHPQFVSKLKRWLLDHPGRDGEPAFDLVMTCRWADWPAQGVDELATLWKADCTKKLMLCPLRQSDVVETLKERFGDDIKVFWEQMNVHHLRPIACWPQGLIGLMDQFERSGHKTICNGYSQAVEDQIATHIRLADTPEEPGRWTASLTGGDWRRRVAGRMAASMIWSGKGRLDLRPVPSAHDALTIIDFTGTDELWEDARRPVRLEDLDEIVHKTRLMRRLSDEIHWVFQSQVHQEFLAAEWLDSKNLNEPKFRQLFGQEEAGVWRVQPALGAVAAWLATKNQHFRQLLLRDDPLILLRMDGSRITDGEREAIVEALLRATARIRVTDPAIWQSHLASLDHPGLHVQLERWLRETDTCDAAKELAIEIAEKTKLHSLAQVLWELYPQAQTRVQVEMAGALYRLATSSEHDEQWLKVLRGDLPIDRHGSLLGAAIELQILSGKRPVREALHWLVPGRRFEVYGLFDMAVRSVPEKLDPCDLPEVLAKLGEQPEIVQDSLESPHQLHKAAVRLAIRCFEQPEVAKALSDYWHQCLKHHVQPHHDYNESWTADELGLTDDQHRRSISKALVNHPGFVTNTEKKWMILGEYLITDADGDWLFDELILASKEDRWRWALAISSLFWREELIAEKGVRLQQTWLSIPEIRSYFPQPLAQETPPEALTRIAQEHKAKRDSESASLHKRREERKVKLKADLDDYSNKCHQAHHEGDITWIQVFRILAARRYGSGPCDITFEPLKQIKGEDEWMIDSAVRFLQELPKHRSVQMQDGLYGLLAFAACFSRLSKNTAVSNEIGHHWLAPMLADLSMSHLGEAPEGISFEQLAIWFPEEMPKALGSVIQARYQKGGELGEMHVFEKCWSVRASEILASILKNEPIQPAGFFNALHHLARQAESLAVDVMRFWLAQRATFSRDQLVAMMGAGLFLFDGRLASELEQNELFDDIDIARDAIWRAVHHLRFHDRDPDLSGWSDESIRIVGNICCLAYLRLERFHSSGHGFHAVSGEDEAVEYRDRIISEATRRGLVLDMPAASGQDTPEEAAQRIRWIDWHRNESAKARLKASREMLIPVALAKFSAMPEARLARNKDELMEAAIGSIRRWEDSLRSGNWQRIWDLKPLRSRDEEDIAKELRDWLQNDLQVVSEREIELRSEHRTDILIQTISRAGEKLTVVIELKKVRKSNARERRSAMQSQLRDIYLKERQSEGWTHGLYVVAWTPEPGHKLDSQAAIEEEARFLTQQAQKLSEAPFSLRGLVVDARSRP